MRIPCRADAVRWREAEPYGESRTGACWVWLDVMLAMSRRATAARGDWATQRLVPFGHLPTSAPRSLHRFTSSYAHFPDSADANWQLWIKQRAASANGNKLLNAQRRMA